MKTIIGIICVFLVFYLVWKLVKRLIFIKIFKTLNNFPQTHPYQQQEETQNNPTGKRKREFKKDIKWDAETVEFEEIPNDKK